MKALLILINLLLACGVAYQGLQLFSEDPEELSVTRKDRSTKTAAAVTGTLSLPNFPDAIALIQNKNIFDVTRCPEAYAGRGGAQMQLLGTYQVNGLDGAIIKQSQMVRRMNFPGARPGARQSSIPLKRFIKVGDTLENGYVLTQVHADHIVLSRNGGTMELYLERPSSNSPATLAARAAAARARRPTPQQQQGMMMQQQLNMMRQLIQNTSRTSRGGTSNRSTRSR